ncbi:MAG: exodeoxyribonuclease VII small subunit [Methanocalculus sp. MSAO_Arc1]|uniref:exodeoxyribonuclease VII small subunit n=1 Tax=Methanocalculus TaxID=71151 RepID=UPI000FF48117|nr:MULTISPECIES: exodeoxyribonuclease VII small subunit [unclassified Methanocalculus]MCP1662069.1 exodeoxyribonuclease VII small subunit [Methanocalculus sp. AMF5]RQD80131.1 MAG: exodeoxyribonuclease VII small subunit [Methanocalculus sp. MSAO_Arc1]
MTETYEEMVTRLREIVRMLENPDTPLDESVRLYKDGIELIKKCEDFLTKAELRILEITEE